MGSTDGSQPLPQGQRRQGHPVPAPVEAVVHFGYPPDLVSSTYQQLLSTSGSPHDVIHTTGKDAAGSRMAENGYVSAALLLVSVEANINFASSSLQSRHEPDFISLPTASEGTLTRCENADDLQGDGGSDDESDETSSRSSSPRRHQNVIRDHESDSPASSLDLSTPSTPTLTEPTPQWTSSEAPAAVGTSATGNTTIPTMPSTGVSANVSSAETSTVTTAPSAANDHSEVSSSSETPTTTTTTITSGDAVSSGDAAGSQHRDLDGTTPTAFTSTATSTTTSSHVVQRDTTPADDKARERRRQLERLRALRAENRRLKARSVCRQCRNRPVALTFLPCGHFLFCQECGSSFSACPVCKKTILADVRTFVS